MKRAVVVICDGLRADQVVPELTPNLCRLAETSTVFTEHRSVFPSTTRTTSASIATGCLPGKHGLEGNCVALDEGDGLVALSVGPLEFRDRLERATGRTLRVPTLAERVRSLGPSIVFSNVSPGAAIFQDPDGHGFLYHRDVSLGPGRTPVPTEHALRITHNACGDATMTKRFIEEVIRGRQPPLAVLWQCEPDHTQHAQPLGSPAHLAAIAAADDNAGEVADAIASLPDRDEVLLVLASDHGHETVGEIVPLQQMLIEAGLKQDARSTDAVVASNGLSAFVYLSDAARQRLPDIVELLQADARIDRVITGDALGEVGHRSDTALAVAVTGRWYDLPNEFGISGLSTAFEDPLSHDTHPGCGQHGGLGPNEQHPFLIMQGAGLCPGPRQQATSAIDIAPTIVEHLGLPADDMQGSSLISEGVK